MLVVAFLFGVVNAVVKPLFKFASAPLILLSLGIFLLVINACLLMLVSWVSGRWASPGMWTTGGALSGAP